MTLVKSSTAIESSDVWTALPSWGTLSRLGAPFRCAAWRPRPVQRCDEAIAAARDGLDVPRRRRVVAEGLAQLGDGLRERVVGDVGVGPQRVEQRFLGDQLAGVVEEVEQKVEELRRQLERLPVRVTR